MAQRFYCMIICIFLFPFISEGANWVRAGVDNFYVDVDSIKEVAPDQYKACFKAELTDDVLIREAERYSFFDCTGRKTKALVTIKHFRDGSIGETGEEGLEDVPPDSIMEDVLQFVCSYKKGILDMHKKEGTLDYK
jgi:hypothetical protein